jgi:IS5 family transposase
MQGKSNKSPKKLAAKPSYISPNQLTLAGFETPFVNQLNKDNRWVKMSQAIPWDKIVPYYDQLFSSSEGRAPISGRIIIGAMIIKHIEGFTDRAAIQHIQENMFMQYFLGYSSFTNEAPFTAPLFVAIRKRMSLELTTKISDVIALHCIMEPEGLPDKVTDPPTDVRATETEDMVSRPLCVSKPSSAIIPPTDLPHKGKLIMDATVAPQHITFPTDLKLLNAARKKSEQLIDQLYNPLLHGLVKPRTYRNNAQKLFLNTAKKKAKSSKEIYKANGRQLRFLRRNLKHIDTLVAAYTSFPLKQKEQKYLLVLHTVYEQQEQMHRTHTKSVPHRIVNIHQPHVRPIVRGKDKAKVEFGSKLQVSLVNGFTFIDRLDWEAFNEGQWLQESVERYKQRFGYYPKEVLADQIYCNRNNRKWMKGRGIRLMAKPLGRPAAAAVAVHLRPGERNPIEGKFGQGKLAYGLDCIKAKLKDTSESWIACIALVLNLVNMTRQALLFLCQWIINLQQIYKQYLNGSPILIMSGR